MARRSYARTGVQYSYTREVERDAQRIPVLQTGDQIVRFGMHAMRSWRSIAQTHPSYIVWCSENLDLLKFSIFNASFAAEFNAMYATEQSGKIDAKKFAERIKPLMGVKEAFGVITPPAIKWGTPEYDKQVADFEAAVLAVAGKFPTRWAF